MIARSRRRSFALVCGLTIAAAAPLHPLHAAVRPGAVGDAPTPPIRAGAGMLLVDQSTGCSASSTASQRFTNLGGALLQSADDFQVPASRSWTLQTVMVSGFFPKAGAMAQSVDVLVYANNPAGSSGSPGGAPGVLVCSSPALVPAGGLGSPNFVLTLTPPCHLGPGTYWLSVIANQNAATNGQWFWFERASSAGYPFQVQDPNGLVPTCPSWDTAAVCGLPAPQHDLCFSVSGVESVDIPALGGTGMVVLSLLLAAAGLGLFRAHRGA
ncbi:MAG TPA: hypothetical protein VHQ90_11315 [Thermoanaerobaculia bacterium]|nr:hypothetical protein [Thermoanaerobaculia bacterium]